MPPDDKPGEQLTKHQIAYRKNREKRLASAKAYYYRNHDKCKAESRERLRKKRQEHPEIVRAYDKARYERNPEKRKEYEARKRAKLVKERPEEVLFRSAKSRAKREGLPFTITVDDVCIPDVCPIFGIELKFHTGRPGAGSPTIDQINAGCGYTPDNIWVISFRANYLKNDGTPEEHEAIAVAVRNKMAARDRK